MTTLVVMILMLMAVFGAVGFGLGLVALAKTKQLEASIASMRRYGLPSSEKNEEPSWPMIEAGRTAPLVELPAELVTDIRRMREENKEVLAVKTVREYTGMGLKEAVDVVRKI